ncbi:hypothetical protein PZ938_03040 [Luteipulveratus sp. YIM 133132]|uniref:hypothetical protein n=1 Tax=Luteipulveratus flavus TaxID=3031728 RepID=UPI0023B059CC|nr:hypothetical protein [Luteipulveratus sp. YIM 133132]MDE9364568.1 hypothetical protein [Luteipulveratus sp. YIM 133132]
MTAEPITFQLRTTLEDIVRELLDSYRNDEDLPGEHIAVEQLHADARRPLLARLSELAEPSRQLLKEKDSPTRSKNRAGSPAPWSAPAAELLDEILNGALDYNRSARRLMGWPDLEITVPAFTEPARIVPAVWGPRPAGGVGPRQLLRPERVTAPAVNHQPRQVPATMVSIETAGRVALRGLPGLVRALRDNAPGRRLGETDLADGRLGQGWIEEAVRSWHRRALELTGHEVRWERLPSVPNPDHWSSQPAPLVEEARWCGPCCALEDCDHESCDRMRHVFRRIVRRRWIRRRRFNGPACDRCDHESCFRLAQRRSAWLPWYCPRCRADSLRRDPVADLVHCMRPSCTDDAGRPSTWSAVTFEPSAADPWADEVSA